MMSLVVKKVTYNITVKLSAFGVDVSKEVSESELRQFHGELKKLESAVADQLGTFVSVMKPHISTSQLCAQNIVKVLQYAQGKKLFKVKDVQVDLGITESAAYSAMRRLVEEKKLIRYRLPNTAWGYSLPKQDELAPTIDVADSEQSKLIRDDFKRLSSEENQARLES